MTSLMWNLKYDTNYIIKQTHRKQICGCQGEGLDWEFETNRCKLLYIG